MDRLQSMRVFCQVASAGSFTRAAAELDMSVAAASRMVVDLENHIRTRLLNRTTRSVTLTEAGEEYFARCTHILAQIEEADKVMCDQSTDASGKLRFLIGSAVVMYQLAPMLQTFRLRHPKVILDVHLAERPVDLVAERFDLAVQPSNHVTSDSVVARKLIGTSMILCASPDYLRQRGTPLTPQDLQTHDCLSLADEAHSESWRLQSGQEETRVRPTNVLTSNNVRVLLEAASSGMGIAFTLCHPVQPELKAGRLVRVLPAYRGDDMEHLIVYPSRKYLRPKVRAMIAFLQEVYGMETPVDGAPAVARDAAVSPSGRPLMAA
jgi:DNA-binding transcriptional LysR family regulator